MLNDARVSREALSLTAAGLRVDIIALNQPGETQAITKVNALLTIYRYAKHRPPRFNWMKNVWLSRIVLCTRMLSRLPTHARMILRGWRCRPDVVHAHDVNMLPTAFICAKLSKAKIIYDSHEIQLDRVGYKPIQRLVRLIERSLIPHLDAMITTTNSRAYFYRKTYQMKPPLVLQNRARYQHPLKSTRIQETLGLAPDCKIVLYQGGLQWGRGCRNILQAAKRCSNLTFVFIGYGSMSNHLQRQCQQQRINNVYFIGTVPLAELHEYTSSAWLGLQCLRNVCRNHYTTDSNKLFEYFNAGLPVIASDFPEIRKIVDEYDTGLLIDPESVDELVENIQLLATDEAHYQRLRQNAFAAAKQLNWQVSQQAVLVELYQRLLNIQPYANKVMPKAKKSTADNVKIRKITFEFMNRTWRERQYVNVEVDALFDNEQNIDKNSELYTNAVYYMKKVAALATSFKQHRAGAETVDQIRQNQALIASLEQVRSQCLTESKGYNSANIIIAKISDLLGQPKQAEKYFKFATEHPLEMVHKLYFDMGAYTYCRSALKPAITPTLTFTADKSPPRAMTLIISLDLHFLRVYGPQLIYMLIFLKQFHFHLHVIGEKTPCEQQIDETRQLLTTLCRYRQVADVEHLLTVSWEAVPEGVQDHKAYFASARYIHALSLMDKFNSDVYIMDADLQFTDNPEAYFARCQQTDISLSYMRGISVLCPWRRFMAGRFFAKNNAQGRLFLQHIRDYLVANLNQRHCWMVDQNALSYAYDQTRALTPTIQFGHADASPIEQFPIRRQIEAIN